MATTKTTTKKTTTAKATATADTTALQAEVTALREQVTTLQNQVAALAAAPSGGDTSNLVTKADLASALRSMGAREWVISKAGLR